MRIILIAILIIAILENNVAAHLKGCFRSHPKESEGEIQLRNYEPNMFCSATLSAPNAHGIRLELTDMDLEYNHIYLLDYLVIFDGPDCMAPRLAVVYSPNHEMSLSSQQNQVSLLFISEHSHQNSGFHLRYSPETLEDQWKKNNIIYPKFHQHIIHNCGMELNTSSSAIFWRVSNEINTLCIWRITNNRGGRILLKINELRINSRTGFVRILDGPDCGAEVVHVFQRDTPIAPQEIQGKSNRMVIVFSVSGGPESTINVTFVLQSPCFPSHPIASNGSIKLRNYPPKMFCSATLSAPNAHGIRLRFFGLDLEYDGSHLLDYLVIFDGPDCMAPRLTVAYGSKHQLPFSSRNNKVSLLFISDYSTQNAGFHLKYRPETRIDNWKKNDILDTTYQRILHNCGTELNTSTSNAMFLKILNEMNTLCIWRITNDRGGTIMLNIEEVQINSSSGFVRILDGHDCNAEVIHVYERHTRALDRKILGTSNTMIVVLSAPSEYGATFKATVSYNIQSHCLLPQPCESKGSIELRHYPPTMFCTTTLSATNASGIRFEFVDIELEQNNRYLFDYLVIFDGPDCMAPRLTVVSAPSQPLSISSKRNEVSLLFISNYVIMRAGFHLRYSPETNKNQWKKNALLDPNYQRILHNCGKELNTKTSKSIFLRVLNETNTLCIWRITNDRGGTITLKIKELQLSSPSGFVRILDGRDCGAELIHIFHQQTPLVKRTIYGTANAMIVVFAEPGEHGATFNATVSFSSAPSTGKATVPLQV